MQKKIEELNQTLIASGKKDLSLNPTELGVLASLCKHLSSSGATKTSQNVSGGLDLAIKLATKWPYGDRLPGLDLLRLLAVAPATATYTYQGGSIIEVISAATGESDPPADNHMMMGARAISNLFSSTEGRSLAIGKFEQIQTFITLSINASQNRNVLVAGTTVYINYAVLFNSDPDATSFEHVLAVLDTLGKVLSAPKINDSEVIYRALVATGTLLTVGEEVKSAAKDVYDVEKSVTAAVGKATDPRIRNVAAEIRTLLK